MIFSFTCFTWLLASLFSHMYVTLSGVMCESEIGLHEIAVFLLGLTRHSLQKYISYKKGRKSKGFHFSTTIATILTMILPFINFGLKCKNSWDFSGLVESILWIKEHSYHPLRLLIKWKDPTWHCLFTFIFLDRWQKSAISICFRGDWDKTNMQSLHNSHRLKLTRVGLPYQPFHTWTLYMK